MIKLTKLNREEVVLNINHIVAIEQIPETKILLTNKEHILVRDSVDEIINKVIDFNAKVFSFHKRLVVSYDDRDDIL